MKILGVDIGGSGIKGAVIDTATGQLLGERQRIVTPQPATPLAVAATLQQLVRQLDWHGPIGIGFPARVQHGIVKTAANIDDSWVDVDAMSLFSKVTGQPVRIVNDADAAGLAEVRFGAARERQGVVLLITIGTGLGTALFIDGQLVPNTELGHILLKGRLAEHYAADAARKREDLSRKKWAKRFNRYLKRLEFLLSPDLFILGGGASAKFDRFKQYLNPDAEVIPAATLNHAGIIGAALYAEQMLLPDAVAETRLSSTGTVLTAQAVEANNE